MPAFLSRVTSGLVAGVLAASGLLAALPARAEVKVGVSDWPGWVAWYVAEKKGFFKKHGADVKLVWFPNYTDSISAPSAGQLDANAQTWSDTMGPLAKGVPVKAILVNDNSAGNDALVVGPKIRSFADLKGKSVALEQYSVSHFVLVNALAKNGLKASDVKIVNLSAGDAAAAFLGGRVEAAVVWNPWIHQIETSGKGRALFTSKDLPGLIPDLLVAQDKAIAGKRKHLVGLKPSLGLLSARGVVPACRTLDTISIFALTADDAHRVFAVAAAFDAEDAYARPAEPHGVDLGALAAPRIGVPRADQLDFCGSAVDAQAWADAVAHARGLGAEIVELDIAPLLETARLLYGGPWVAERYQAIRAFIDAQPDAVFPVTREITLGGARPLAADAFAAQYRLKALQRQAAQVWRQVDALLTPTAPTHPTIEAMLAEPIARNSELGLYTNFMNLLDWAAVAVPAGFVTRPGATAPMPHGVTLCAPAHQDVPLLHLARRWQAALQGRAATLGATGQPLPAAQPITPAVPSGQLRVAVCGAHLEGQPLNGQLTSRGARLITRTTTTPDHRLYALPPIVTPAGQRLLRPALVHTPGDPLGRAIEVEVWELPAREFGSFVAAIPAPLGIGKTRLADGSVVPGFICEEGALAGATDITGYGGWRAWVGRQEPVAG